MLFNKWVTTKQSQHSLYCCIFGGHYGWTSRLVNWSLHAGYQCYIHDTFELRHVQPTFFKRHT